MADIRIIGHDEEASRRNAQSSTIVFKLSDTPTKSWIENFNSFRAKNRNLPINSAAVQTQVLTVQVPNSVALHGVLGEMKQAVEAANNSQDDFHKQLGELKYD